MRCSVQRAIAAVHRSVAAVVSRWPLAFVFLPLLLCGSFTYVCYKQRHRFTDNPGDAITLFMPSSIPSYQNIAVLRDKFPSSSALRDTYHAHVGVGHINLVDESEHRNVLRPDVLEFAKTLYQELHTITLSLGLFGVVGVTMADLCEKMPQTGRCLFHPLYEVNSTERTRMVHNLRYPKMAWKNMTIDNENFFGGVSLTSNSTILRATALRIPYALNGGKANSNRFVNYEFEEQVLELVKNTRHPELTVTCKTSISWPKEIDRNGDLVRPYLPHLAGSLTLFSVLSCTASTWSRSKPFLALCGVFTAAMAIVSCIGTMFFAGADYVQMVMIMPFLVLSISVDNMFLLLHGWRVAPTSLAVEQRIQRAVGSAALSITVTTLTDAVAFLVGVLSSFAAIRVFCMYCAVAVGYSFLYQITFFTACMTLSGRIEHSKAMCCCNRDKLICTPNQSYHEIHGGFLSRFFGGPYATFISHWSARFFILVLFIAYVAGATFGVMRLQIGIDIRHLVPYDSYVQREFAVSDLYFRNSTQHAFAVLRGPLPYHDPEVAGYLMGLYSNLTATPFSREGEFWLEKFYESFLPTNGLAVDGAAFAAGVRAFVRRPENRRFAHDVKFSRDGNAIVYSKIVIRLQNFTVENYQLIQDALSTTFNNAHVPGFVYHRTFLLNEQESTTLANTVQSLAVAALTVMLVSSTFIGHFLAAFVAGLAIVSINFGVIGCLAVWDVRLDIVTMVTLVMSIGFSADFVVHIIYHYLAARDAASRIHYALHFVGAPILQSALSTLLGVACLAGIRSYMIEAFVKTVFLVICSGMLHGLVFLPAMLYSLFNNVGEDSEKLDLDSVDRTFVQPLNLPGHHNIHSSRMISYYIPPLGADLPAANAASCDCGCHRSHHTAPVVPVLLPRTGKRTGNIQATIRSHVSDLYGFLKFKFNAIEAQEREEVPSSPSCHTCSTPADRPLPHRPAPLPPIPDVVSPQWPPPVPGRAFPWIATAQNADPEVVRIVRTDKKAMCRASASKRFVKREFDGQSVAESGRFDVLRTSSSDDVRTESSGELPMTASIRSAESNIAHHILGAV